MPENFVLPCSLVCHFAVLLATSLDRMYNSNPRPLSQENTLPHLVALHSNPRLPNAPRGLFCHPQTTPQKPVNSEN